MPKSNSCKSYRAVISYFRGNAQTFGAMKIKSIIQSAYLNVEMEDSEYVYYRTYGCGDNWEVLMGESWEPCYSQEDELKKLFQDYVSENEIVMDEEQELRLQYQEEVENCFKIAQKLDAINPDLKGSFTGTPSERIVRQLNSLGIYL